MNLRYFAFVAMGAMFLHLMNSCNPSESRKSGVLVIGIPGNINLLNPELSNSDADRFVCRLVYGTLVENLDKSSPLSESLSNSWLVNSDSSRFIIYLKNDLFYSEAELFGKTATRPVVALDVVASIKNYIVHRKFSGLSISPFEHLQGIETFYDQATPQTFLSTSLDGMIFSDDHTLVFEFYEPEKNFFQRVSDIPLAIRPFEFFSQHRREIIGFGYYTVQNADSQKVVIKRSSRGKKRDDLRYDRIEIWQNLTYERMNQFLTEGSIDMALDLTDDFMRKFLETNIHRIQNTSPDFKLQTVGNRYRIFSTTVDSTFLNNIN